MKKVLVLLVLLAVFVPQASAERDISEYIEAAMESGVVSGDENGVFHENKTATRGEFAVMLTKFLELSGGRNVFADVKDSDWYCEALSAAHFHGMLSGDENGMARPQDMIKCEDAVTVLGRYYTAKSDNTAGMENVSEYAREYFAYALERGLISADENPLRFITKGELLKLMYEYDRQSTAKLRFLAAYPRLAESGAFSHISIEIRTNKPCTLYYGIAESGTARYSADNKFCDVEKGNTSVILSVEANISKTYDVYLKIVTPDGVTGSTTVMKGLQPFAIASGDGTVSAPYIIYTPQQLAQVGIRPGKHYRLGADIAVGADWQGIPEFSGVFDGDGFRISGININDGSENYGLFKIIKNGTVRNLAVDADVKVKKTAGVIVGKNEGGVIEGCTVTGSVSANTDNAGGICGTNSGTVKNCLSAVYSVAAGSFAGGIAGQNYGLIENCLSAAEVVASDMYAGAISGTNDNGRIKNCVGACMTVYDTLTRNSGRLTTNKKNGVAENNYCYGEVNSNASYEEPGIYSQNGFDVDWVSLCSVDFYKNTLNWAPEAWTSAKDGFRLIRPKKAAEPQLEPGKTAYFPKTVSTPEELRAIGENEAGHYILTKDITLSVPWKTICTQNGFSGTFDGNGYTIYNLNLTSETGMFSNITGGTVKNLTLRSAKASPGLGGAILTACNYGYIRNCAVFGQIDTKKAGYLGTIAGENYGEISGCEVRVDIKSNYDNATVGGICAENNGIITDAAFWGKISSSGENAVVGGICGHDIGGYIFGCFSGAEIAANNSSGYIGGICGIAEGSQLYKCASGGRLVSENKDSVYAAGVCALAQDAAVYNCFSRTDIYASAKSGYSGGVTAFNSGSNVQNTYSAGNIIATGGITAGGICGFAENGFVMQNVVLNPAINASGAVGAVIGSYEMSEVSDNFSCEKTIINSKHIATGGNNGTVKSLQALKAQDFYYKPVSEGGLLGWGSDKYGEDIWTAKKLSSGYDFPMLSDVRGQETLTMPVYK